MSILTAWNAAAGIVVTEPGIYNIPADIYHRDPVEGGSLSASGSRKLLPPHCPAVYQYEREHRPIPTKEFSFGHAAHKLVLGVGPELVVVHADNWRTDTAKDQRDQALADGNTPILEAEYQIVLAMAAKLREHPIAAALVDPDNGTPEQSLFWKDAETGVWCRAMLDWLRDPRPGRLIVPDYKTAVSASPAKFEKALYEYDYHRQAAWYLDGVKALQLDANPAFVFVVQEKTPPYLVSVFEPDALALEAGRYYNRQARLVYAQCQSSGRWPGYSDEVEPVSLPAYAQNKYFQETGQ